VPLKSGKKGDKKTCLNYFGRFFCVSDCYDENNRFALAARPYLASIPVYFSG
jgi:hypothetical protein